jgi:acyl-CoA synthetase (AMP-forming)/AMP-acid ligase II
MNSDKQKLIHNFLEQSAQLFPDKVALIHEEVRASYSLINNMANHLAYRLIELGVTNYDRIAFILNNSLEYVVTYYGILKSGAVAVPLNTDLKPDSLSLILKELEPKVIISSSKFERLLQATALNISDLRAMIISKPKLKWPSPSFQILKFEDLVSSLPVHPACPMESDLKYSIGVKFFEENSAANLTGASQPPSLLASIIYTSGSTGKPKGVMLSHGNIVSNTHSICQYLELTEKDIQMAVLPFFYVMGKSLLNTHFAVGGTVVINNKFAYPATVLKQMVDEHVTGFSGVPSTYAYLLHRSPLAAYRDRLNSLRYCSQAGGHMSKQIKKELRRVLPGHTKIYIMYGATEASARLTYLDPHNYEKKIDSIGKAIPGVVIKVLNPEGIEVAAGEEGELVVSGPNIMQGYFKDEDTTKKILDHNGYHTGDMGYRDQEGYFYAVGRKDGLLKVGGHRISLQEIEDVLMETELLTEVAVIGVKDDLLGNKLKALAVPKDGEYNENMILQRCSDKLPAYKLPSEIRFVQSIPKNLSGKIDRNKCIEFFH